MPNYSEVEVQTTVRGLIDKYGVGATKHAAGMLANAIQDRDPEMIGYWRAVIKALGSKA